VSPASAAGSLRFSTPVVAAVWGCVAAASIFGTLPQFAWHVEFFRVAGDGFYQLLLLVLPLLFVAPLAYHRIRTAKIRRCEPALIAALVLGPAILYQPSALLIIAAFAGSCYQTGVWLFQLLEVKTRFLSTGIALRLAAGMTVQSLLLFALGMAGLLGAEVFVVLCLPALFVFRTIPAIFGYLRAAVRSWADLEGQSQVVVSFALFYLAIFALITGLSAITPATNGDAVRGHLSLAKSFMQAGGLAPAPFLSQSYGPQSFEILMAGLWTVGGQAAAQLLNPFQFIAALVLLFGIGREMGLRPVAALLGVSLAVMVPFLHWTGSVVKNDLGAALYLLAALTSYLLWLNQRSLRWIYLVAFYLGSSFNVKATALFGAVPLGLLILYAWWRHHSRVRTAAVLCFILAATGLGSYLVNWRRTGNPVYPEVVSSSVTSRLRRVTIAQQAWRYIRLPWRAHFRGRLHFESPTENPMGLALIAFAPALILARPAGNPYAARVCWIFILCYLAYWSTILGMVRYAIAPLLLLFLKIGARLDAMVRLPHLPIRFISGAVFLYCAVFSTLVTVILEMYPSQPALLMRSITGDEFLRRELAPFGAIHALNGQAGPDDLVLSVGAWSISYAPFPARVNHIYRDERRYTPADLAELGRLPYRFLILPAAQNLAELERAAASIRPVQLIYSDSKFRLYRTGSVATQSSGQH
jgi:hypothetical protein